jgi:transposase
VPCSLIKKRVDVRITVTSVECFHKGQRVSVHPRSMQKGRHTTVMEHMPKSHQEYAGWTPERIMEWARKLGPNVSALTEAIMDSRKHPVQGYRSCLGVIGLAKEHGTERLDAACERALHMGALSHKSLKSILKSGLDRLPLPIHNVDQTSVPHDNVRGPEYYRKEASC